VEVEGADQSEVWGSFRVARRARPGGVRWESDGERTIAQASHDGYRRLRVPVLHRRTFAVVAGSFWLVIDELFGHGTAAAENHIHLHPGVAPVATSASEWRLEGLRTSLHLSATEGEHVRRTEGQMLPRRQGWYSEQFGIRTPNVVLSLGQDGALPRTMAYVIARDTPAVLHFAEAADRTIVVEHGARRYTLAVPVDGPPGWRS
jgi:hypothetical protein